MDSIESAIAAGRGGATRLELCSSLPLGGTTPPVKLFELVRKYCSLKVHVLIRPRFGDFLYSNFELEWMENEVEQFRELGADGVVFGCVNADGTLNMPQMQKLIDRAGDLPVTLHRAFDVCSDPKQTLSQAVDLGVSTILTSGQRNTCVDGKGLIAELIHQAEEKLDILVGGGVSAEAIQVLRPFTKARCYHMSGRKVLESSMRYRNEKVSMGTNCFSEFEIWRTDEEAIARARQVLEQLE